MCSPHSLFIALAREPMHDKMLCFVTPDCQHLAERHREKFLRWTGLVVVANAVPTAALLAGPRGPGQCGD